MKDITFRELKDMVGKTPQHMIEDMGFTYKRSDGHTTFFKFDPIEIPVNDEELIRIRDEIYDRGGDPNRIVLGVYELFEKPDYGVPNHQSRTECMLASFFVKG